jgi:hypothetical protein
MLKFPISERKKIGIVLVFFPGDPVHESTTFIALALLKYIFMQMHS